MDTLPLILLVFAVFLLVICVVYLVFFLPKKQEKSFKTYLDSLSSQQKETSKFEEDDEERKKAALELKTKIEEIAQRLITDKEVTKTLLENVDKNIKGEGVNIKTEIANQQKMFQEKNKELSERLNKENKELSEKLNKDLEFRLNSSQQLI